jgi:hypothetical protein
MLTLRRLTDVTLMLLPLASTPLAYNYTIYSYLIMAKESIEAGKCTHFRWIVSNIGSRSLTILATDTQWWNEFRSCFESNRSLIVIIFNRCSLLATCSHYLCIPGIVLCKLFLLTLSVLFFKITNISEQLARTGMVSNLLKGKNSDLHTVMCNSIIILMA